MPRAMCGAGDAGSMPPAPLSATLATAGSRGCFERRSPCVFIHVYVCIDICWNKWHGYVYIYIYIHVFPGLWHICGECLQGIPGFPKASAHAPISGSVGGLIVAFKRNLLLAKDVRWLSSEHATRPGSCPGPAFRAAPTCQCASERCVLLTAAAMDAVVASFTKCARSAHVCSSIHIYI